jgi:hypothetical protein
MTHLVAPARKFVVSQLSVRTRYASASSGRKVPQRGYGAPGPAGTSSAGFISTIDYSATRRVDW